MKLIALFILLFQVLVNCELKNVSIDDDCLTIKLKNPGLDIDCSDKPINPIVPASKEGFSEGIEGLGEKETPKEKGNKEGMKSEEPNHFKNAKKARPQNGKEIDNDPQLQKIMKGLDKGEFVTPDGDDSPKMPEKPSKPSTSIGDISRIESSIEDVMKTDLKKLEEPPKPEQKKSEKPEAPSENESTSLNDAWEKLKELRRDNKINILPEKKDLPFPGNNNPPPIPSLTEPRFREKEPNQMDIKQLPKDDNVMEASNIEINRQMNENLQRFEDDMQTKFAPTENAIKAVSGKLNEIAGDLTNKVTDLSRKIDSSTNSINDLSTPIALLPNITATQQVLVKVIAQMAVGQQETSEKIDTINKQLDDLKAQLDESDEQAKKLQLMSAMKTSGGHGNPNNLMSMMSLFDNFGNSKKKKDEDEEELPKKKSKLRGFLEPPSNDNNNSLMDLLRQIKN